MSSTKISTIKGISNSAVGRILKRRGLKTRPIGSYERTKEHRDLARKTLIKNLEKFSKEELKLISKKAGKKRGEQLKLDREFQRRVGRLGGLKTQKLHPGQSISWWNKDNPELQRKISSETAKKTHKKYPDLASRMGKSTQKKHPTLSRETLIKTHKKYPTLWRDIAKKTHKEHPGLATKMGKATHQKHPELARQNALKAIESQRKNKPYYWQDVPFASKEEMEVAKLFLDKPIEGINVHVKI